MIAASNHPWDLDEAIRRRLEKRIYIPLPDISSRETLFKIMLKGEKISPDVDLRALAAKMDGYSGADIATVCRDAAMMVLRFLDTTKLQDVDPSSICITKEYFDMALQKTGRSVGNSDIKRYVEFEKEFRSA